MVGSTNVQQSSNSQDLKLLCKKVFYISRHINNTKLEVVTERLPCVQPDLELRVQLPNKPKAADPFIISLNYLERKIRRTVGLLLVVRCCTTCSMTQACYSLGFASLLKCDEDLTLN